MSNLFDSTAYYRMTSDLYGTALELADGYSPDIPNTLFLGTPTAYSSGNWQVLSQDGIYFVRNYDYGATYQLGIIANSATRPQLIAASGDLSQQWNITSWPDGTFKLTNMAVGKFQMLGVSNDTGSVIIPVLNLAEVGSHWTFDINSAAGEASEDMLRPLTSIAIVPSRTSPSVSTAPSTTAFTPSRSETLSSSTSPLPAPARASGASNTLSSGALVGVIIGAIILVALVTFSAFVLIRRRRRARGASYDGQSDSTAMQKNHRHSELKGDFPPVELPIQKQSRMGAAPVEMAS